MLVMQASGSPWAALADHQSLIQGKSDMLASCSRQSTPESTLQSGAIDDTMSIAILTTVWRTFTISTGYQYAAATGMVVHICPCHMLCCHAGVGLQAWPQLAASWF